MTTTTTEIRGRADPGTLGPETAPPPPPLGGDPETPDPAGTELRANPDVGGTVPAEPAWGAADIGLCVGLSVLAAALRLPGLATTSRWLDDLAQIDVATRSYADILALRTDLLRPPLYDLLLGVTVRAFGTGAVPGRALSVLASAATVGITYALGRRALSRVAAAFAAGAVAVTPLAFDLSHDIRPDALLGLAAAASWWTWVRLREASPGRPGPTVAWLGASLAAIYIHPWGCLAVASQAPFDLGGPGRAAAARRWGLLAVLTAPSFLWLKNLGSALGPPLVPPDPTSLFWSLHTFAFGDHLAMGVALLLLGAAVARSGGSDWVAAMAAWLLLPLLGAMAVSHVGRPIYDVRYASVGLPALWLLAAAGIDALPRGVARHLVVALVLVVGAVSLRVRGWGGPPRHGQWDDLGAAVRGDLRVDDVVAGNYAQAWKVVLSRPLDLEVPEGAGADAGRAAIEATPAGRRLFWLLGEFPERYGDATAAVTAAAPVLRRYARHGAEALLVRPHGRPADLSRAAFDPPREPWRDGEALFFFFGGLVRLPGLVADAPGVWTVDVVARGTPANGEPARLVLNLPEGRPLTETSFPVGEEQTLVQATWRVDQASAAALDIAFVNDGMHKHPDGRVEDRNLWIDAVVLTRSAPSSGEATPR